MSHTLDMWEPCYNLDTKHPWAEIICGEVTILRADGPPNLEDVDNVKRAADCVNACTGWENPLESRRELEAKVAQLQERLELLHQALAIEVNDRGRRSPPPLA